MPSVRATLVFIISALLPMAAFQLFPTLRVLGVIPRSEKTGELGEVNTGACRKIHTMRACEDTWLHEESGYLYSACGNSPEDRMIWFPCNDHWDPHRRPENDYLAVLDTRGEGTFEERTKIVKLQGFKGMAGEGSFTSHGMAVWVDPKKDSDRIRIFLVNHRPPVDALTGALIGGPDLKGGNGTVEIFETTAGSDVATHVRTVAHPDIRTPNSLEPVGPDAFYVTNDHHVKKGLRKQLDIFFALSDVAYCDTASGRSDCHIALKNVGFANGISVSPTDPYTLFLSATSGSDTLVLTRDAKTNNLSIKQKIYLPYASDNLWISRLSGNFYEAIFPHVPSLMAHFHSPRTLGAPTAIAKISPFARNDPESFYGNNYKVEKIFQDDSKDPLSPSGITGMAVDEATNKIYLAGLVQDFMFECDLDPNQFKRFTF